MDLRQLSALTAIADHGSFSAAAEALSTVQSNVSAHVKRLERELNTLLVDRSNGELTEAGRLVVACSRRARAELDALISDVLALNHDVAGTVRVGIIGTTARWLVPRLLDVVPHRFPLLRLVFLESTTNSLGNELTSGHVDLVVWNLRQETADLSLTPLFEEELVLVAAKDDPLGRRQEVDLPELAAVPLLLPLRGTAFRRELDLAARPLGIELKPRAEIDGVRLIASLVFEGYGPAILPATAVPSYLRDRWALVRVPQIPPRVVGVAQRARSLPSAPTRAVLDVLTSVIFERAEMPPGLTPLTADHPRVAAHRALQTRRLSPTEPASARRRATSARDGGRGAARGRARR